MAVDPLVYDNTLSSGSAGYNAQTGTLGFDWSFNLNFGGLSGSQSNRVNCDNTGNYSTNPIIKVTGPVVNPRIVNETTTEEFELTTSIASSEVVTIDMQERTVKSSNGGSLISSIAAGTKWFKLIPGVNELVYLSTSSSSPNDTSISIEWRSAWT